jgi:hypothetical protein
MSRWIPILPAAHWRGSLGIAFAGALLAGIYGAVHDQLSYTISPEYFTKFKFRQFSWADAGMPARVFVAQIGFLASWWAGLIAGWLLARLGLTQLWLDGRRREAGIAFAIVPAVGILCGLAGLALGFARTRGDALSAWNSWQDHGGIEDLRSFVMVAHLHWAAYAGAVVGTLASILYLRRALKFSSAISPGPAAGPMPHGPGGP